MTVEAGGFVARHERFVARRERFAAVGSTNDVVRGWLAAGTPEVCIAVADEQTAGRGRDGRTWIAPPGAGLLASLGFRPTWLAPDRVWRLAALVSLAMADAAEDVAGLPEGTIRLKWPNDLAVIGAGGEARAGDEAPRAGDQAPRVGDEAPRVGDEAPRVGDEAPRAGDEAPRAGDEAPRVGDEAPRAGAGAHLPGDPTAAEALATTNAEPAIRKLGGVLGETSGIGTAEPTAIVGIGVNADWRAAAFPPELAEAMTSLREASGGRPIDREVLLEAFLDRLETRIEALRGGRFDVADWTDRQLTTGRDVRLETPDGRAETVRAIGVDPSSGALVVEGERQIFAGEIRHLRLGGAV